MARIVLIPFALFLVTTSLPLGITSTLLRSEVRGAGAARRRQ